MKKVGLSMVVLSMFLFVACQGYKDEIARLQFQNDSIAEVNSRITSDFEELLQLIDEVETSFLQIEQTEAAINEDQGEQLKAEIAQVIDLLNENQEKIALLEKQVKSRNYTIANLQKTIDRLKAENEEKAATITELQQQLAQRDDQIKELDESVASLNSKVDALSNENKDQQDQLAAQDKALNTVCYAMGKKKELKAQGIIVGKKTLTGPSVDASNFTVVDLRELSSIDFPPTVKKAVLLTSHPEGSYTLVKEGKVMTKLTIDNPEAFWSISKYLVISY